MRLVFMGTPAFASTVLEACLGVHVVVEVYTRPDAISGRGKALRPSPVKELARAHEVPVREPRSLRNADEQAHLVEVAPEAIVVAAYGLILPREVLGIPRYGCINVHGSLLPRWRGAAPVQRAILAGDEETGVSIMRMEEGLDTGPYDMVARVAIDALSAEALTQELARAGAAALLQTLDRLERGEAQWTAQDDARATYAEKITRADVAPHPEDPAELGARKVRASSPQAAARVVVAGRPVTLLAVRVSSELVPPGRARCGKDGVLLGFADGALLVTQLKPDGKPEMDAAAWARGARLADDAEWTAA